MLLMCSTASILPSWPCVSWSFDGDVVGAFPCCWNKCMCCRRFWQQMLWCVLYPAVLHVTQGSWQASLLAAGEPLGTCTLNTADCGKVGKQCCREDVPESGSVFICESRERPGSHYCTADNICAKCPEVPTTKEEKAECRAIGQPAETEGGPNSFSARGGGRIRGSRG